MDINICLVNPKHNRSALEAVRKQYPFENLRYSRPALRMHYKEAVAPLLVA